MVGRGRERMGEGQAGHVVLSAPWHLVHLGRIAMLHVLDGSLSHLLRKKDTITGSRERIVKRLVRNAHADCIRGRMWHAKAPASICSQSVSPCVWVCAGTQDAPHRVVAARQHGLQLHVPEWN